MTERAQGTILIGIAIVSAAVLCALGKLDANATCAIIGGAVALVGRNKLAERRQSLKPPSTKPTSNSEPPTVPPAPIIGMLAGGLAPTLAPMAGLW